MSKSLSRLTGLPLATCETVYQTPSEWLDRDTLDALCAGIRCQPGDLLRHVPDDDRAKDDVADTEQPGRESVYNPLRRHLETLSGSAATYSFGDIERIIGRALPPAARRHRPWWGNNDRSVQAAAWLGAGWKVDRADLANQWVTFSPGVPQKRQLPPWDQDEFRQLLCAPHLSDAEAAATLPRRSQAAVTIVRQFVHRRHSGTGQANELSHMMQRVLDDPASVYVCPICGEPL